MRRSSHRCAPLRSSSQNYADVRAAPTLQFVGADTAQETLPLLHRLRAERKGCLFAYSVEVDEDERSGTKLGASGADAPHKQAVEEMLRCIDIAADFEDALPAGAGAGGRKTWVAIKMVRPSLHAVRPLLELALTHAFQTALLPDAQSLINLSSYLMHSRPTLPRPAAQTHTATNPPPLLLFFAAQTACIER